MSADKNPALTTSRSSVSADVPASSLEAAWQTWKASPGPDANATVLDVLGPTIDRGVRTHMGDLNPLNRSRARAIALQALGTYDPRGGANLSSHIFNHLRGLKRYAGRIAAGVRLPERAVLERNTLDKHEADLLDELGREPNDDELADRSGFSVRKLKRLRSYNPAVAEGAFNVTGDGRTPYNPAVASESTAWRQIVYDELAPLDKKVFEWTTGYNGRKLKNTTEIAHALRRSPGWVSQRRLLIQRKLDEEGLLSPFGG